MKLDECVLGTYPLSFYLLQVLKHHGTSQQTFLTAMNKKSGDQTFGANLAYDNAVVLWLLADQTVLGKLSYINNQSVT